MLEWPCRARGAAAAAGLWLWMASAPGWEIAHCRRCPGGRGALSPTLLYVADFEWRLLDAGAGLGLVETCRCRQRRALAPCSTTRPCPRPHSLPASPVGAAEGAVRREGPDRQRGDGPGPRCYCCCFPVPSRRSRHTALATVHAGGAPVVARSTPTLGLTTGSTW